MGLRAGYGWKIIRIYICSKFAILVFQICVSLSLCFLVSVSLSHLSISDSHNILRNTTFLRSEPRLQRQVFILLGPGLVNAHHLFGSKGSRPKIYVQMFTSGHCPPWLGKEFYIEKIILSYITILPNIHTWLYKHINILYISEVYLTYVTDSIFTTGFMIRR